MNPIIDSYCHPDFRGKGLHNYMNQWSLCGMKVEKTFYSYSIGKRFFTNL